MPSSRILRIKASGQGLHEVTETVRGAVAALRSEVDAGTARAGLVTLFLRHTSASLLIQENADPSARADLEAWVGRIAPEGDPAYTHVLEGPDDMPAHLRTALTATSLSVPLVDGELALGTWQGIYLFEHRRRADARELVLQLG